MSMVATDTADRGIATNELLISADSHVMEPFDLWSNSLEKEFGDQAPTFPAPKVGEGFQGHPGGHDPKARLGEMVQDGVSAEVLYPTLGLGLFGLEDARLQEAAFRVYNDWLINYCQTSPDRLLGIPCISAYDMSHGVAELERCAKSDLKGAIIWQAPHPDLPLSSEHYNPFWAAAQDLDMPVSLHILTGHSYFSNGALGRKGIEHYRGSVNLKMLDAANALFDLVFSGVLDRYPRLKIVIVENEIGWLPFLVQQWDYYFRRFRGVNPPPIEEPPSFYIERQVYATFFNDAIGCKMLNFWGQDNCMWSNDFPHPNSTWPHSRDVIARDLAGISDEVRAKLVRENVVRLYGMTVPEPA
jgi:predicted TIM-barrel fold metal-dependent hydrolase